MKDNKDEGIFTTLAHLIEAYVQQVTNLVKLAHLELHLASISLVRLIFLAVILIFMLFSVWLSIQAVAFFTLLTYGFSFLSASIILTIANFILSCCLMIAIIRIKKYLFFPATRKQLKYFVLNSEEPANEKVLTRN